jgi:hypothetical protein
MACPIHRWRSGMDKARWGHHVAGGKGSAFPVWLPKTGSVSRGSSSHKFIRGILCYPPFIVCNPSFGRLFCSETRHHRRETSGHVNFNAKGQVLLRNDPKGSAGMRMFFGHAHYMGIGYAEANAVRRARQDQRELRSCHLRPPKKMGFTMHKAPAIYEPAKSIDRHLTLRVDLYRLTASKPGNEGASQDGC